MRFSGLHSATGRAPGACLCVICSGTAVPLCLNVPIREANITNLHCQTPAQTARPWLSLPSAPSSLISSKYIYGAHCMPGAMLGVSPHVVAFNAHKLAPVVGPMLGRAASRVILENVVRSPPASAPSPRSATSKRHMQPTASDSVWPQAPL